MNSFSMKRIARRHAVVLAGPHTALRFMNNNRSMPSVKCKWTAAQPAVSTKLQPAGSEPSR
eukprot:5057408-Heterocapsa_arctica.AAC.1